MDLESRTSRFLETVISHKNLHGLWLNTLSFLEYMGTRKIAKALCQEIFNETLLDHLNEEARHSLYFKKLARRVASQKYGFQKQELLAGPQVRAYFQNLDEMAEKISQKQPFLNYLLTTWTIEKRAVLVYNTYNCLLRQKKFSFSLNPVLQDEKNHLHNVKTHIEKITSDCGKIFQLLRDFETKEFKILMDCMETELEKSFPLLETSNSTSSVSHLLNSS